jgi:4-hydroxybutyrate dehydrogenase
MATLTYANLCHFDFGALKRLPKALASLGVSRPLIVTDKGVRAAGLLDRLTAALDDGGGLPVYDDTPANPTEAAVLAAAGLCREEGCDGIVALGGGSAMDCGKAAALMALSQAPLAAYAGLVRGRAPETLPVVAIPTTAGTGSEVSVGFIVVTEDGRKLTFVSDAFIPKVAICDPELTLGLPPLLTAATGMDAVTHAIEAVLSPAINPPAEAIGLDALEGAIGAGHLERAVADGSDREARWQMMMAATEGAYAFVKGLGAVHAMSHACGALPGLALHHGTLNAVLLPTVLRHNAPAAPEKMRRIAAAMGLAAGADVGQAIAELNRRLGLPASLAEMGVTEEHISRLAAQAAEDLASRTNPVSLDEAGYRALLAEALASG